MFMIHLPNSVKVGDTVDCKINGELKKVTWRDADTLVIEPGDARHILMAAPDADLICFMCGDADGSGSSTIVFSDEDGEVHSVEINVPSNGRP